MQLKGTWYLLGGIPSRGHQFNGCTRAIVRTRQNTFRTVLRLSHIKNKTNKMNVSFTGTLTPNKADFYGVYHRMDAPYVPGMKFLQDTIK